MKEVQEEGDEGEEEEKEKEEENKEEVEEEEIMIMKKVEDLFMILKIFQHLRKNN